MTVSNTKIDTRRQAQERRAAFTQERILDAAESVFALRGLAGTRVREIAEAAGVNGATLYNYYASKDALYEAVLERGVGPLSGFLADFAKGPPDRDAVRKLVRAVMQHLAERPHFSKLVYHEAISQGDLLPSLARRWFRPILEQISGELKGRPTPAFLDEPMFPYLGALFVHLSFGHFAIAPLFQEATGEDPVGEAGIEQQTRLIETLVDQFLLRVSDDAESREGSD